MSAILGGASLQVVSLWGPRSPEADMEMVRSAMASLDRSDPRLTLGEPLPTAAFTRRDALRPGYPTAVATLLERGYAPVTRPVGGNLAVYDQGSVVLYLWGPHRQARLFIRERFELFGDAIAGALRTLGVDARLGPVPGEYCDGEFSINHAGRAKLAGTGQRINRHGFLFSAVVMVTEADRVREALTAAYADLGLDLRPETVACVADAVPGVTVEEVRDQLVASFAALAPVVAPPLACVTGAVGPSDRAPHGSTSAGSEAGLAERWSRRAV